MKRVIGITGGIASGKSFVCSVIQKRGFIVIDSDEILKELSQKGQPCYQAILEAFGPEFLDKNDEINRHKLGKLIFTNSAARLVLNNATHPLVLEEIKKRLSSAKEELIFLDVPLLYESKFDYLCDKIICVYVSKKIQVERLIQRDGIDEDYALEKIHSQMDLEMKKLRADYVIDSEGSFENTTEIVLKILNQI